MPLHLATAALTWSSSLAALPLSRSGSLPWNPVVAEAAAALAPAIAAADPAELAGEVAGLATARIGRLVRAIEAYRDHPFRRPPDAHAALWSEGATRLLDLGGDGPTVLVVPSLVNRWYVLDLEPGEGFLSRLAAAGHRVLVVDWGDPGPGERGFGLADYVAGRLEAALDRAAAEAGGRPVVLGYCMGGLLAAALAARRPADVAALVLLATPFDFHAERPGSALLAARTFEMWAPGVAADGCVPVDVLQLFFWALDPWLVPRKFLAFGEMEPGSAQAAGFVALEDWVNDGVPLPLGVARDCLVGWYGENRPASGHWRVAGRPADPGLIRCPSLVVVPDHDRIVPSASAAPLAAAIPGAERRDVSSGHVGMVAGRRAPGFAAEVAGWLAARLPAPAPAPARRRKVRA